MKWTVPRDWEGETVVILAGGLSLRGLSIVEERFGSACRLFWRLPIAVAELKPEAIGALFSNRVRIITINDSWRMAPWADVCFFQDAVWWNSQIVNNRRALDGSCDFADMIRKGFWVQGAVMETFHDHPRIHTLKVRMTNCRGLEKDPAQLAHGSNSGYAAINLAYHFGVKRIILLGYDMHGTHWHDEPRPGGFDRLLKYSMLPNFDGPIYSSSGQVIKPSLAEALKAEGVEVINSTPRSALACWPYVPIEEALMLPTMIS